MRAGPAVASGLAQSAGLAVSDAVVTYGAGERRTTAVDGVSLSVSPGEVVALLGPSGCGKSSLLRAVAGLEPLAGGSVAWDGEDLEGVPVHRRGFGLMFQDGQLFAHRDVAGNVGYGLRGRRRGAGAPRRRGAASAGERLASSRAERVAELLELVGLAGFERRSVATLSGGEAQRVALARALAPSPRLLLLDEPLSALDRALRESLAPLLRRVLTTAGTTALYVTHDHDEAFTVADRVAVMSQGRLLQVDTPAALWAHPRDAEVARFLGYGVADGDGERGGDALVLRPGALRVAGPSRGVEEGARAVAGDGVDVTAGGAERAVAGDGVDVTAGGAERAVADDGVDVTAGGAERAVADDGVHVAGDGDRPGHREAPGPGHRDAPGRARRTGVVRAVRFRRGAVEALLDVDGWGEQVALVPGDATVHAGDVVGLAVDPDGLLRLPRRSA